MYINWIKKGVHKEDKSVIGLADALGVSRGTIYKILEAKRRIRADELPKIAAYIGESAPGVSRESSDAALVSIPIERTIGVGIWFEDKGAKSYDTITVQRDSEFPKARHLAFKWRGDSMDAIYIIDGDILICLAVKDGTKPIDRQLVVIERNRDGVLEQSLKVVAIYEDRIEYRPMSNDPSYKPVVVHLKGRKNGIETVKVIGLVRKVERITRNTAY